MVKNAWKRVLAFVLAFAMVVCDAGLSNLVYAADEDEIVVAESTALAEGESESTESEAMTYLKEQLTAAWDAGEAEVTLDESYGVTKDMVDEAYEDLIIYDYKYFYVSESYGYTTTNSSVTLINVKYGLSDGTYDDGLTSDKLAAVNAMQEEIKAVIEAVVNGADSSWTDVE